MVYGEFLNIEFISCCVWVMIVIDRFFEVYEPYRYMQFCIYCTHEDTTRICIRMLLNIYYKASNIITSIYYLQTPNWMKACFWETLMGYAIK